MRRAVIAAAAGLFVIGTTVAGVLALRDDGDGAGVAEVTSTTRNLGPGPAPGPQEPGTTTTAKGAPVQSGGAAPVSGAILSIAVDEPGPPVDVGDEADCDALDPGLTPVGCVRVEGSGGTFLVLLGRRDDGALQSRLYRATTAGGHEFVLVRRSPFFAPGGDVVAMTAAEAAAGREPVVVVDYDFDGSGAVHSFDVVAWDSSDVDPRVVAFVNGTGGDRLVRTNEELRFVGANYDDGAPTCCPNHADVRTVEHPAPGQWAITTRTVPFSEAP